VIGGRSSLWQGPTWTDHARPGPALWLLGCGGVGCFLAGEKTRGRREEGGGSRPSCCSTDRMHRAGPAAQPPNRPTNRPTNQPDEHAAKLVARDVAALGGGCVWGVGVGGGGGGKFASRLPASAHPRLPPPGPQIRGSLLPYLNPAYDQIFLPAPCRRPRLPPPGPPKQMVPCSLYFAQRIYTNI
jgi:hypothetical protein